MSNNKPLRRGVDGICTRSTCECEREGLGDQCVWLKPAPGCKTPEGCRENGCLGWCDEHRPDRPPTPVGWSDTDWLKHLEEIRRDQTVYHRGPLPETGWD